MERANFRSSLLSRLPHPAALLSSPRKPDSSISLISYIATSSILGEYGNEADNNSAHTSEMKSSISDEVKSCAGWWTLPMEPAAGGSTALQRSARGSERKPVQPSATDLGRTPCQKRSTQLPSGLVKLCEYRSDYANALSPQKCTTEAHTNTKLK